VQKFGITTEKGKSGHKFHGRIPELDLLRFVAATSVAFYHLAYRPLVGGVPNEHALGYLSALARYGYLGVDLFFIISGFVIVASAVRRPPSSFVISRFARLYPTFWVCVALATLVSYHYDQLEIGFGVRQFLANMTMIPGQLGETLLDDVYWTLFVEIKFYALCLAVCVLLPRHHFERFLHAWLAITVAVWLSLQIGWSSPVLAVVKSLSIFPFSPLFIAGSTFFLIWNDGSTPARWFSLFACLGLAVWHSWAVAPGFTFDVDLTFGTASVIAAVTVTIFAAFAGLVTDLWSLPEFAIWERMGSLTYPLYLLHNQVGKILWLVLPASLAPFSRLAAVLMMVFLLAFLVSEVVERRISGRLSKFLHRHMLSAPAA
jgi:peptidoglycan/LPS O-acetylase OafA/YrhL